MKGRELTCIPEFCRAWLTKLVCKTTKTRLALFSKQDPPVERRIGMGVNMRRLVFARPYQLRLAMVSSKRKKLHQTVSIRKH